MLPLPPLYPAVTASVPPSGPSTSSPINAEVGGNSRVLGASKPLGVPTTGASIREGGEGQEKKQEQEQRQDKKYFRSSAVSRLREMFERNNSDSKKRASLEARPLPRRMAAMAVSSIGEHEVIKEAAAIVAPASADAADEPVSLDATVRVQTPVVTMEGTTAGSAPTAAPITEDGSSAAEESSVAVAAEGAAADENSSVDVVTTRRVMTTPPILGASSGALSTPTVGMTQAPIATVEDVIEVSVMACKRALQYGAPEKLDDFSCSKVRLTCTKLPANLLNVFPSLPFCRLGPDSAGICRKLSREGGGRARRR